MLQAPLFEDPLQEFSNIYNFSTQCFAAQLAADQVDLPFH
jgi:hypothetical protein